MSRIWRAAVLLLGTACSSGGAPAPAGPTPTPAPGPGPMVSPTEPSREAVRYPRSGAGIARYAFARRDSVVATMPNGEQQQLLFGRTAFLTLTWVAADSGTRITAAVDSLVPDSAVSSASLTMLDSARGARWTAFRTSAGRLVNVTGGSVSLTSDQIRDQLTLLFPLLPKDGARPGDSWRDSLQVTGRISAFESLESVVVQSSAGAASGNAPLPIEALRQRSAVGKAVQFGQELTVSGTGLDSLSYALGADGRVLSAVGQRHSSIVVTFPVVGQTVPAEEATFFRMTLLR